MSTTDEKPITLQEVGKITPYSADYLSLLVRKGRLEGFKKDGKWYCTKKAVDAYTSKIAEANYQRQENLKIKIPAEENKKALVNLKWALALAAVLIITLTVWGLESKKNKNGEFVIEKDSQNNLIIHAENPDSVRSVTIVPKE